MGGLQLLPGSAMADDRRHSRVRLFLPRRQRSCCLPLGSRSELADLPGWIAPPRRSPPAPRSVAGRRRLLPSNLGPELGHLTGQRPVFVCPGILTAGDRGTGLASPASSCSSAKVLLMPAVAVRLTSADRSSCRAASAALLCHGLQTKVPTSDLGLVGLGGELLQGLAGGLLTIGDHLCPCW